MKYDQHPFADLWCAYVYVYVYMYMYMYVYVYVYIHISPISFESNPILFCSDSMFHAIWHFFDVVCSVSSPDIYLIYHEALIWFVPGRETGCDSSMQALFGFSLPRCICTCGKQEVLEFLRALIKFVRVGWRHWQPQTRQAPRHYSRQRE